MVGTLHLIRQRSRALAPRGGGSRGHGGFGIVDVAAHVPSFGPLETVFRDPHVRPLRRRMGG